MEREQILRAIQLKDLKRFKSASIELRGDKEIGLLAVKRNGMWFRYLSTELRNDKEIIFAAVNKNPFAIPLVSYKLKRNREFALEAVKNHPDFFKDYELKKSFNDDEEIVRAAMESNCRSFSGASERLRNNKEIALIAIKKAPDLIREVSDEIRKLIEHTDNPATTLESIIEKEKLEARHNINSQKTIPDAL